jgi:rubrerythrin
VVRSTVIARTSIQATDELADELHRRKEQGESHEDVIRRLMDIPGEYRIDCNACGFDGGTFDYAKARAPEHCPGCGIAINGDAEIYATRVQSSFHDSL